MSSSDEDSKRYSSVVEYVEEHAGPEFARALREQIAAKRNRENQILDLLDTLRGKTMSIPLRNKAWFALVAVYDGEGMEECAEPLSRLLRIAAGKDD